MLFILCTEKKINHRKNTENIIWKSNTLSIMMTFYLSPRGKYDCSVGVLHNMQVSYVTDIQQLG